MFVSPQCCHGVAQLVYDSAEQQSDEEVGQLTGGQIDTRDLKTHPRAEKEERHTTVTETQQEHRQSTSGWKTSGCFNPFYIKL